MKSIINQQLFFEFNNITRNLKITILFSYKRFDFIRSDQKKASITIIYLNQSDLNTVRVD